MAVDEENTVWITLTNLDGFNGLPFEQRTIPITREHHIKVGRASNEVSKDRASKSDNALFHCSVLTRDHARIELPYGPKGPVTIKDLSSRHGTFVNGTRLIPGVAKPIHDKDTIQIGSNIDLGENVHKCMYLQITATFPETGRIPGVFEEASTHRGRYAVPSDSEEDINDERDLDEGDNDDQGVPLQHLRFESPTLHSVVLDGEPDDESDAESDAVPDEQDLTESSVTHSVEDEEPDTFDEDAIGETDEEDEEEEEEYEPESVDLQLPSKGSVHFPLSCAVPKDLYPGLWPKETVVADQPIAAHPPPVPNTQMLGVHHPMGLSGDYCAPFLSEPAVEWDRSPLLAPSAAGDLNDAIKAQACPGVEVPIAQVLQNLENAVHETAEPLPLEEVAPVRGSLVDQCEEINRKLDAMKRTHRPTVETSAKPTGISIASLVNPEPQTAGDAAPKRKADVLDFNEALYQAAQTSIAVEESTAAKIAKDRSVELSSTRPHKRPRTLLKEGLKATAYVVAGSVATFSFLLSPLADRIAQV
ncbi:hypothetical protein MBLNU457_1480t1 [Dothideomycetes sp. NU457]